MPGRASRVAGRLGLALQAAHFLGQHPQGAVELHVLVNAIRRAGIDANSVDHIILGHGYQSSYTPNTARFAALRAGLPAGTPAVTVQRQ